MSLLSHKCEGFAQPITIIVDHDNCIKYSAEVDSVALWYCIHRFSIRLSSINKPKPILRKLDFNRTYLLLPWITQKNIARSPRSVNRPVCGVLTPFSEALRRLS
jgi:hypothetical protein